jgi:nicotinamide-nucleotide amidase
VRASILSIGSELLRGDIVDTNAAFLSGQLSRLGFTVRSIRQVGDDLGDLTGAVTVALQSTDVLVCTGGLGPTQDDLTREAIAAALAEELYFDQELVAAIETRFAGWGHRMPDRNRRQGMLIPSAKTLPNPNGSAPGWYALRQHNVIVAMPGPPGEMMPMWHDTVQPLLERLLPNTSAMRTLMTFGVGESALEEKISDVIAWRSDVTVATYAKQTGVEVHVTARAERAEEAEALASEAERRLRERLGLAIFGTAHDTLSAAIGRSLSERGLTLAVLESCSGGTLSSMITDREGSSDYFVGGLVAYSPATKIAHGVAPDVITQHGLYSKETALAMASAARHHFGSDVGLGVTGIAGTETLEGKAPGTCFVAVSMDGVEAAREIIRPGDRETVKRYAALCALDLLRRQIPTQQGSAK